MEFQILFVPFWKKIEEHITESKRDMVRFLKEQVTLLVKERVQYSSEVMVLACILHTISPHAYKFLRSSGFLVLSHQSTISKVWSFQLSPQNESGHENFLKYITHR